VQVISRGEPLPHFDLHCPLLSLARVFETRVEHISGAMPYVVAVPELSAQWAMRLGERRGLRVGLVWSGNPAQQDNERRSISLTAMMSLCNLSGVELFSLQKELRSNEERELVASGALRHFGDDLASFADTAALLANMDLVISVCTSVAHLAGAMNKPLWVMLHYAHDWRWLLEREDSPWYPTAKLYRQSKQGEWGPVIERVVRDCAALAAASAQSDCHDE
jgi:hypothetical protein